ncbi:MAG: dephospho-CoA kinase [Alphaproteobacteria bacterium]
MHKVAITGRIGTGKTTVSRIIKSLGYDVFESDKEAKKILLKTRIITKIETVFGNKVLNLINSEKQIDTNKLGDFVFENKSELQILEKIIHPEIWKNKKSFIKMNKRKKILFFDIPLLFEKNIYMNYDSIIYTKVDFTTQKKRVLERKNMTLNKFNQICMAQKELSRMQKKKVSLEINTKINSNLIEEKLKVFIKSIFDHKT